MNTRTALLCALLILIASTAACAPAQPRDPAAVVQTANDRLARGDVDGFMKLVDDHAVMEDSRGRYLGAYTIRRYLETEIIPARLRTELSNLVAEGKVVTYTAAIYRGDVLVATELCIDVVVDGKIIFDGTQQIYDYECEKNPSQAFCIAR